MGEFFFFFDDVRFVSWVVVNVLERYGVERGLLCF